MMHVAGLLIQPDYVTDAEAEALLAAIDGAPWLADLARRVQHYGFRYDYRRRVGNEAWLGPLPGWLDALVERLVGEGRFTDRPDQAIVNEYLPGQGISAHIDCIPCFGPVVASLSLGSGCTMEFLRDGETAAHYLDPRTLVVLNGEARYAWRHRIRARRSDPVDGARRARGRRVSITFRTVLRRGPGAERSRPLSGRT